MSRVEIFTPKQRMVMAKNMQPWLEDMFKKAAPSAFEKQLESLSVRHVPGEHCWLRGSGIVKMQLVQEGVGDVGEPFEVEVFGKSNSLFEVSHMAKQMADQRLNYLSSHPGRTAYKGAGGVRGPLMKRAIEILVADIQSDAGIIEALDWSSVGGQRLLVTLRGYKNRIGLEIKFKENGLCHVEPLLVEFNNKLNQAMRPKEEVLCPPQKDSARRKIAEMMVHAVQNKHFAYPYKESTMKMVADYSEAIKTIAKNTGISKLALAGAVADAFDEDLVAKVNKTHEELTREILSDISWYHRDIDALTSEVLNLAIGPAFTYGGPIGGGVAMGVKIAWDLMDSRAKKKIILDVGNTCRSIATTPGYLYDLVEAYVEEKDRNEATEAWLIKSLKGVEVTQEKRDLILAELVGTLCPFWDEEQLQAYSQTKQWATEEKIMNAARNIQIIQAKSISNQNGMVYVTRWDRFAKFVE